MTSRVCYTVRVNYYHKVYHLIWTNNPVFKIRDEGDQGFVLCHLARVCELFTNLIQHTAWSFSWQRASVFEIQGGGGHHLQKYSSDWFIIIRNDATVLYYYSVFYFCRLFRHLSEVYSWAHKFERILIQIVLSGKTYNYQCISERVLRPKVEFGRLQTVNSHRNTSFNL